MVLILDESVCLLWAHSGNSVRAFVPFLRLDERPLWVVSGRSGDNFERPLSAISGHLMLGLCGLIWPFASVFDHFTVIGIGSSLSGSK